ncbi:MAG TPA: MmgE/PrpD family protein, partial [Candidatus Binatia bacterium]|nr:MmgE/PrpD family protein [Candidatus Binatia bacterium]
GMAAPAAFHGRGWHATSVCGTFAAALAAGVCERMDRAALTAALGIAGSLASGVMEFLEDGSWTKRFHPGWAACAGLHAAALARAGFRAPATILEGRFGFLAAYSDGAQAALVAASDAPELMRTAIKPHACCRYMQGPIDAALALRATSGFDPRTVERIEVGMLAPGFAIVCEPAEAKRRPTSVVDAQFSLPFGVALALVRGTTGPDDFAADAWNDPVVRALMDRVVALSDPALDARFPRAWPCWVRIARRDGAPLEARVDRPRGDAESFPDAGELDRKFRALAGRALAPAATERLAAAVDDFPRAPSARALLAAAVPTVT